MSWKIIKPKRKFILDEMNVRPVHKSQYAKLKKFHYISQLDRAGFRKAFGLFHKDSDILYGIIMYNAPLLELKARKNTPLGKFLKLYKDQSTRYKKTNELCTYISRIVIHPSVRGIGSAAKIVEDSWRETNFRFVEGMGQMVYYRNFLPKSYSYFVKVENILKVSAFFTDKQDKGAMHRRVKSPVLRYGYVLYINEKIKVKH